MDHRKKISNVAACFIGSPALFIAAGLLVQVGAPVGVGLAVGAALSLLLGRVILRSL